ncbi:hypothetical protein ABTW95_34740, partial [Spirillospora sp. NPDC127506]
MSPQPILLQVVIRQRRLQRYGMFQAAYNETAKKISPELAGTAPSRAQLHRWTSGELKRLPYTDHCRVLASIHRWCIEVDLSVFSGGRLSCRPPAGRGD